MSSRPRVSVLMAAYDAEATIGRALRSALASTLEDLEVVVVDDGSTDGTAAVVEALGDSRVRLLRSDRNQGLPLTRQRGADAARGEYLAILDSDDVAHPRRLERQAAYLDTHRDCALVGTWARIVTPGDTRERVRSRLSDSDSLRGQMLFNNVVKDCTAMTRTALVQRYRFRAEFTVCELVDLWQRMAFEHEVANLPEVLTIYHDHPGGISKRRSDLIRSLRMRLVAEQLDRLGVTHEADDLTHHLELSKSRGLRPDGELVRWAEGWLPRLRGANRVQQLYPEPAFTRALGARWWKLCTRAGELGSRRFGVLCRSPLRVPALRHRLGRPTRWLRRRLASARAGGDWLE